jgi:thioredoxin 1
VRLSLHLGTQYRSVAALICMVAGFSLIVASGCSSPEASESAAPTSSVAEADDALEVASTTVEPIAAAGLPRLVDLGAKQCIPCKMMAPILEDLMENYADQFETEFIDVWEHSEQAEKYGIQTIPTQIFFDAEGNEQFRHEGFMSKEDILANWKKLGVEVRME